MNDERIEDNDERIEDNDLTASTSEKEVIDNIENDITNPINGYDKVEVIYNEDTTTTQEEVTLEE